MGRLVPLAELAQRGVYQAHERKLGKLHVRSSGVWLLCKNAVGSKRWVGTVRKLGGVERFPERGDVCVVCARELSATARRSLREWTPDSDLVT